MVFPGCVMFSIYLYCHFSTSQNIERNTQPELPGVARLSLPGLQFRGFDGIDDLESDAHSLTQFFLGQIRVFDDGFGPIRYFVPRTSDMSVEEYS